MIRVGLPVELGDKEEGSKVEVVVVGGWATGPWDGWQKVSLVGRVVGSATCCNDGSHTSGCDEGLELGFPDG